MDKGTDPFTTAAVQSGNVDAGLQQKVDYKQARKMGINMAVTALASGLMSWAKSANAAAVEDAGRSYNIAKLAGDEEGAIRAAKAIDQANQVYTVQRVTIEAGKQLLQNHGKITNVSGLVEAAFGLNMGQGTLQSTALAGLSLAERASRNKHQLTGLDWFDFAASAATAIVTSGSGNGAGTPAANARAGAFDWRNIATSALFTGVRTFVAARTGGEDAAIEAFGTGAGQFLGNALVGALWERAGRGEEALRSMDDAPTSPVQPNGVSGANGDRMPEGAYDDTSGRENAAAKPATRPTTDRIHSVSGNGDGAVEAVSRRYYGENWRAGAAAIIAANNLKTNSLGSPIIHIGDDLKIPDLAGVDIEAANKLGGEIIAQNQNRMDAAELAALAAKLDATAQRLDTAAATVSAAQTVVSGRLQEQASALADMRARLAVQPTWTQRMADDPASAAGFSLGVSAGAFQSVGDGIIDLGKTVGSGWVLLADTVSGGRVEKYLPGLYRDASTQSSNFSEGAIGLVTTNPLNTGAKIIDNWKGQLSGSLRQYASGGDAFLAGAEYGHVVGDAAQLGTGLYGAGKASVSLAGKLGTLLTEGGGAIVAGTKLGTRGVADSSTESLSFINNSSRLSHSDGINLFKDAKLRAEMSNSTYGQRVLQAADSGEINLTFSTSPGGSLYGRSYGNQATVYLENTQHGYSYDLLGVNANGYQFSAGVGIHEGMHSLGVAGSRRAEALARLAELDNLGVSIDRTAMRQVLTDMGSRKTGAYSELPWLLGETAPAFPNLRF